MTTDGATELFVRAFILAGKIAGPLLLAALVMGLIVGVLQAATQVNEASISFVTKLIAVGATFAALGSWTLRELVEYTARTFASIADVVR